MLWMVQAGPEWTVLPTKQAVLSVVSAIPAHNKHSIMAKKKRINPDQHPEIPNPDTTPELQPDQIPEENPAELPEEEPEIVPEETPEEIPEDTPDEDPGTRPPGEIPPI